MVAPFEEETTETEVQIDDEPEEIEPVKKSTDPGRPTAAQFEDHRMDHLPYRCWCKWCVLGRGRGDQHRASAGSSIPLIGPDYFYMTTGGMNQAQRARSPVR